MLPCSSLRLRKVALAVSLALAAPAAHAQLASGRTTQLDSVTVTASGTALDLRDAPASVSVITAQEIQKVPAADLNTVLSHVPGLSQATTPDGGTSIQIRGLPQGYTLLLVDGRRVGSSNDTFDRYSRNEVNWIPPESIERIEIIRGPMSSLYGSDAMGGVINIITKKTADRWGGSVRLGAEVNEDSIRGNDYSGGFSVGGPLGKGFRLRLNGERSYQQADHELPEGRTGARWGGGREGSKLRSFGARLDWEISKDHELSLNYMDSRRNTLQSPLPAGSNPTASTATRGPRQMDREELSLSYAGKHDFGTSKLSVTRTRYENQTTAPVIVNNVVSRQTYPTQAVAEDLVVDGSLSMPLTLAGMDQMLTVGAQWQRNELDNPNSVGTSPNREGIAGLSYKKANNRALFMEDQIYLRDDLNLTLGARWDDNSDFGDRVSPRAYLVWHPASEWTLRGGYSTAFKAPSLRQGNPNFAGQSQGAGCAGGLAPCSTYGNANLKPETSKNFEIGADWEREGWKAGLTAFNTDFKNKIQSYYMGEIVDGRYIFQYYNVHAAVTRGIEGNLTIPLSRSISWSNNFTHMFKAEEKGTGAALSVVPKWSLNSKLDFAVNDDLGVTLQAQYIGKQVNLSWRQANQNGLSSEQRIQNGYTLFDVGVDYRITSNLRLDAGVKNLLDKDPNGTNTDGNNFYTPGRRYFVTLTASF